MKGFGIYVENKLLTPKDCKAMREAIWLYLWLLDRMTSVNEKGIGLVLGGKPVTFEDVNNDLGISRATYKRYISILRDGGYVKTTQAPYGIIFKVIDTKKIFKKRGIKSEPPETDSSNMSQQSDSSDVSQGGVINEPPLSECEPSNIRQDNMTRQKTRHKGVAKATKKKAPDKPLKPCKPPGVNIINQFWKLTYKIKGNPPNAMENLGAAEWLYNNKGEKESLSAIAFAKEALEDHIAGRHREKYPPTIYNLMDLKDNYDKLRAYYGRKYNKKPVIG